MASTPSPAAAVPGRAPGRTSSSAGPPRMQTRCSVAVFRGESVLLVHSSEAGVSVWKLPGGHVHAGEGLRAGARRELREKTGLEVADLHAAFLLEVHDPADGRCLVEIVMIPSEPVHGDPSRRADGRDPQFVAMAELDRLPLRPPIAPHLHDLLRLHRRDLIEDGVTGPPGGAVVRLAPGAPRPWWDADYR